MRTVTKLLRTENRLGRNGEYKLKFYRVEDELGNFDIIDTPAQFDVGDRVEVWHDGQYNKMKMRLYKENRA